MRSGVPFSLGNNLRIPDRNVTFHSDCCCDTFFNFAVNYIYKQYQPTYKQANLIKLFLQNITQIRFPSVVIAQTLPHKQSRQ